MKFFNTYPLIAFTGDASQDFTPTDFSAPLTAAQQSYLKKELNLNIAKVFWRKQVHATTVLVVKQRKGPFISNPPGDEADAYITRERHVPIAIRTADCVPIFLYDPVHQAIGLAHAGWKGTKAGIAAKTLKMMQSEFGSLPADINVALGPCIRPCCYEVGEEFKAHFPGFIDEDKGKCYADMPRCNAAQLMEQGVPLDHIEDCGTCTVCQPGYFSFRRDGEKAGRLISLMMLV